MYELDKTDPISRDAAEKTPSTHVMERYFVKVRRRPRRMACFVNFASVDRIICAIFNCLNEKGSTAGSGFLPKQFEATSNRSDTHAPVQ
jgi:hypothetical protein